MGYSWTKLIQDEFGRKGAKQSFALALILMMFAGVFAFILPAPAAVGSNVKTNLEGFDKTAGKWSSGSLDGWKELDWVSYRLSFRDLPEGTSSYTFNVYHNNLSEDKYGVDRLRDFRVGDEDGNPVTGSVTVSGPFYETLGKWGDRDIYYTILVSFTTPSPRLSWYLYWQAHLAFGASGWPGSSLHAYTDISGKVSINVPPTPIGSISGYKWNDLNRDGTWDSNEQGISGWTIQLYRFEESAWTHLADENTDSAGRYTFSLVAGSYRLYEVLKDNWTQTFPPSGSHEDIALSEGETKDNINFGNFLFPTITTRSATGITTTRATMNADFTIGSYNSVDVWFQYRVQGGDTWIETTPVTYTASGSHSDDATGLSPVTTYEFRAVLQYDTEIIHGNILTFTTSKVIPTVTTNAATGVTVTQATMNTDFTVGIYDSVDVWFEYRVQGGDTWIEISPTTYTASGSHSDDATGLSLDTIYEFRAALQYDTEIIHGNILTFTTLKVIPTVTTNAATGVTVAQATMNTDFTVGIYDSVDVWFEYRVHGSWIETTPVTYTASGSHSDDATGLSPDTTYEFRAVLQYDTEIIYGDILTFTTLTAVPTVTTRAATGVTVAQATMNADFTVGIYDSVDVWFEYRVQGGDAWIETTPTTYTSSGSHSDDVTGLSPDTTYEFRAVLQYDTENIYGDVLTFTTSEVIPTVTTKPATGVTTTQATMNADFTVGSYGSVDVWFQYRVQGGDTWIETTLATYTASGSHSDDATGLSLDTTYEFRAVLQYDTEIIYGDSLTFTTKAVQPPSAPTLESPADGMITNDNTPTFKWTVGANANNHRLLVDNDADFSSPEKNVLIGATDNTYTISAPGLADGNYSWKVIAINADGENESSTWTFVIDTIAPSIPTPNLPADSASTNDNTVYFEWSSIPDAEYYDLFIDNDPDFSSPEVIVTVTDNYYTSSALLDGSYSWRVRARDAANNMIDNSATRTFLIDTIASSTPTLFLPADSASTNDNTVYFEWFIIADAENYDLLVDDDSDFNSPEISVTVTNNYYTSSALGDESYFWRVRARYADNEIYNSVTWTFVIDTIAPATSTLVSTENNAVESALTQTFTWTEPEVGVMYDIQIDNETSFTSPYVHENTGLANNSYTYTFASNGVYYWRVRAVDAVNNQSSWADNFRLAIQAPPGQPTLYLSSDGVITNENAPTFEWTLDAIADYYRLLVDNDPDFSSPEENLILLDNYYNIAGENSLPDDNYSWKVIAINVYGEIESSTWTFVIDTIAPSIPTPSLPADGDSTDDNTVYFEWSSIPDAEYYDLFIDDDPDFSSPEVIVTVTGNYYTSSALPDGSYSWRVRARDAANNMIDNSATRTFLIDTTPVSSGDDDLETVLPPLEGALSVTIGTITAGETGSADFTRHAITVTGVRITTTRDVSGARVDVKMRPAKPVGVDGIALHVYIYFDLSTTIDGVYINGATIRFRVPRSWIAEMNIDEGTIRLLRYKGTWQRLPTGMINADSTYFHYEATMPGFSLFAIVGEPRVAPTSTPWGTPTVPPPTQAPPFLYAALFMSAGVFGLAMAYSFARPSRYYVMLKRLKQLERELIKPEVRHIGLPLPEPPAGVAQIRTHRTRDKRKEGGIMSKAREAFRKFEDANWELRATERELHHMEGSRWSFRKNMLKFGFAAWVFGLSVFLLAITLMSTELFGGAPLAWSSMLVGTLLLVGAPAAPVTMTSVFIRKHDNKIKRLRHDQRGLVTEYQGAALQYVGQVVASGHKNARVRKAREKK